MTAAHSYWRCDWTHRHDDEPVNIFYEVTADGDVLRLVDVFRDGLGKAEAVADYSDRPNELPGIGSLCEGSFLDHTTEWREAGEEPRPASDGSDESLALAQIDDEAFEAAWQRHRGV